VPLRALKGERYIFFPREVAPSYYDLVISSCKDAGFSLHVTHQAEQYLTILGLIAGGLGLALVPASVSTIGMRGVAFRALQAPLPQVELAVVYRRDNQSELLHLFLKTTREVMRKSKP
jgi:DNA-binding transcriptional LysR family regulator